MLRKKLEIRLIFLPTYSGKKSPCHFMFRRSCKYPTLLCQFCYNPLQLKVLGICYSLQSCPAAMIYCETLLLNLYIIPFMTRKGQKSSIISVAIYKHSIIHSYILYRTHTSPFKKTCKSRFAKYVCYNLYIFAICPSIAH